jgi:hypothetical protein
MRDREPSLLARREPTPEPAVGSAPDLGLDRGAMPPGPYLEMVLTDKGGMNPESGPPEFEPPRWFHVVTGGRGRKVDPLM